MLVHFSVQVRNWPLQNNFTYWFDSCHLHWHCHPFTMSTKQTYFNKLWLTEEKYKSIRWQKQNIICKIVTLLQTWIFMFSIKVLLIKKSSLGFILHFCCLFVLPQSGYRWLNILTLIFGLALFRALSAGCKKPLLVCPAEALFSKARVVSILGALSALYVVSCLFVCDMHCVTCSRACWVSFPGLNEITIFKKIFF